MMIKTVRYFNVYGKGGRTCIQLPDGGRPGWHVFAGVNGSGKTTLLRLVALTMAGREQAHALMPSFARWAPEEAADVTTTITLVPEDQDRFQGTAAVPPTSVDLRLTWHPYDWREGEREEAEPTLSARGDMKWLKRGPWHQNPRGWLMIGYGPYRGTLSSQPPGTYHVRHLASLFDRDTSLPEVGRWLRQLQFQRLEDNKEPVCRLLNNMQGLLRNGLFLDGTVVSHIDSEGVWLWRSNEKRLTELRDLNDGHRVVATLILDLLRQMQDAYGDVQFERVGDCLRVLSPAVVLIDHVEAHLHVSWQQHIGFWLTEHFPHVQFLVTTHSPFVCQAAAPGGLFRMPSPRENRLVEPVDEETYLKIVNGSACDALLTSLFGMNHTRSQRAEALVDEWSKLRVAASQRKLSKKEKNRFDELTGVLWISFGEARVT